MWDGGVVKGAAIRATSETAIRASSETQHHCRPASDSQRHTHDAGSRTHTHAGGGSERSESCERDVYAARRQTHSHSHAGGSRRNMYVAGSDRERDRGWRQCEQEAGSYSTPHKPHAHVREGICAQYASSTCGAAPELPEVPNLLRI